MPTIVAIAQKGHIFKEMFNKAILLLSLASVLPSSIQGEYFSSVDRLETLGIVEKNLVTAAQEYLGERRHELEIIKKFLSEVQTKHRLAKENVNDYLGNPLNAFSLIKRLIIDWEDFSQVLAESKSTANFESTLDKITKDYGDLPDEDDIVGAAKGLARMQEVYNFTPSYLAQGDLDGNYEKSHLTWHDCYEIAVKLFESKFLEHSIDWFDQALYLLHIANDLQHASYELDILEYLSLAHHELGNAASHYLDKLVSLGSASTKAEQLQSFIELTANDEHSSAAPFNERLPFFQNYTRLCQGKVLPTAPLNCHLDKARHAYFTLAPLKVEPLNLDPSINLYHGLLNDKQINAILKEGDEFQMERSLVASDNGGSVVRDLRVSQQTWLAYNSTIMKHVANLVHLISGFDLRSAEIMQLANYGIGGLYEPHHDYFEVNMPPEFNGDRISTSMFYLSDVAQGGYTVFPYLNVFSVPVKGALVMWYNLHRSLDVDVRTLHAGCPVIKGSKRIGNIWMHSGYQEFIRPCELVSDAYKSDAY